MSELTHEQSTAGDGGIVAVMCSEHNMMETLDEWAEHHPLDCKEHGRAWCEHNGGVLGADGLWHHGELHVVHE